MPNNPLISIIIPIYNVEKHIVKCATTLFEQDFDSIEYIFVNDCSPDNSMQILQSVIEKYPNRKDNIKIINNEKNNGIAFTRKFGLDNANGEYILFIDSDDWTQLDMVSSLYKKAKEDDADVVVCDYYYALKNKNIHISYKLPNTKFEIMNSFAYKANYMNYFWNKLVKKDLYKIEYFLPIRITMTEDLFTMFKLFFDAKKISQINKPLYYYNQTNTSSIMKNYKLSYVEDKIFVTNSIIEFLKKNNAEKEYANLINFYKLYIKMPLIIYPNIRDKKLWQEIYPEANKYVWKVPLKFRSKILVLLCKINLFKFAYFLADLKRQYNKFFS
ncbi:MAG: glycosyltransferase family 2 protein [Campylobacter sp.]|nr:glycosyltransferase family 2 protein [Campylobacter sp.]